MKPTLGSACLAAVLAVAPAVAQESPAGPVVTRVELRHVGPPAVSDDLIRANLRMRQGEVFSIQSTDDAVRSLRATGYFSNVRVTMEAEGDGVKVTYILTGRPVITEIRMEGNRKYSNRKLLKKVTAKTGEPVDDYRLFMSAQEMQKLYQKAGYQRARVEHRIETNETLGRAKVTFVVTEAPKIRVVGVQFDGAEAFSQRKLRQTIKTRRWWMFSWLTGSGKLKDEQFDEDKEKLREFYQDEGYIDFDIRKVTFEEPRTNRMVIRFDVFEGKPYQVGKVTFQGNTKFSEEAIRRGLSVMGKPVRPRMLEGEVFTPKKLREDTEAIEDFYGARGYIGKGDMERIPVRPKQQPNVETGTMDLTYQIVEGEPSRVEKIEIRGNTKTRDRVIRRELAISPGETFNMVRVKISKQRLEGLNFFSKVDTSVDPAEGLPEARNLVIAVEEGQSGQFYVGAGFSSVENLFGFVGVTLGNFDAFKFESPWFTGAGQKFRLELALGTQQQRIDAKFVEPWFLGRRLMLELDAFHRDISYYSSRYDQRETGGRVGLVKAINFVPGLRAGVSYTLQNIGIDFGSESTRTNVVVTTLPGGGRDVQVFPPQISPELAEEEGDWLVSKAGLSLTYDRRGPGMLPDRGFLARLSLEVGGGPLGGETDFYRWDFETSWYFRGLLKGHVLELGAHTGVVEPYGDSERTHIWDRYYLGGAYSLRGYRYRDVSPLDSLGEAAGGNTLWLVTAEYSIPIVKNVRLAGFYDAGCVNVDAYNWDTERFADNVGVGLRIVIPQIGPLRLDYAFPITYPDSADGKPQFQFSVGYTRPL